MLITGGHLIHCDLEERPLTSDVYTEPFSHLQCCSALTTQSHSEGHTANWVPQVTADPPLTVVFTASLSLGLRVWSLSLFYYNASIVWPQHLEQGSSNDPESLGHFFLSFQNIKSGKVTLISHGHSLCLCNQSLVGLRIKNFQSCDSLVSEAKIKTPPRFCLFSQPV